MRVYVQSRELGKAIAKGLLQLKQTQKEAAKELNITQGQISHLISGDFKTKNGLVRQVCKYVSIDPDKYREYRVTALEADTVDSEAIAALARACRGQKQKTAAVIRVLRALENLDPTR